MGEPGAAIAPVAKANVRMCSDVLFAGVASPSNQGASLVVLRLADLTLIDTVASRQVIVEAERNLRTKIPPALAPVQTLAQRCLRIVPDPEPGQLHVYQDLADTKDLPILVAAIREECTWLVTFNIRHYQPGHPSVSVLLPGAFVLRVRELLAHLA